MARMKENHKHVDLRRYCAWYRQNYRTALEYVLTKRYDPIHVTRTKRVEHAPYAYEISTWEEGYVVLGAVRKILFHEMVFLDMDGNTVSGRIRYITLPVEYINWYQEVFVETLENFVERVLPVDSKYQLLEYYGLMVMKRSPQRNLGFMENFEVQDALLYVMSQAMRREFKNKKTIWFCKTELMHESQQKILGFWEIKGTGHAISGVPGYNRKGKVAV